MASTSIPTPSPTWRPPVVTAWVIGAILRPIAESAERRGVPRVVAVIVTATVALLILLAIMGLLSTPLAYWIGHTRELALLIKEKLQLLYVVRAFRTVGLAI